MYEDVYIILICQKNNKSINHKILNISNLFHISIDRINKYDYNFNNHEEIEKQKQKRQIELLKSIKQNKNIITNYKYIWFIDEDIEFVRDAGIILKHNYLYSKYHYTNWNILYLEGKTLTPMYNIGNKLFKSFLITDSYCYLLKIDKLDILLNKYQNTVNKNSIQDNNIYSLLKPILIYPNICYSKKCNSQNMKCYTTYKKQLYHNNFYYYSFILLITLVLLLIFVKTKRLQILLLFILFILLIPGIYSLLYILFLIFYYLFQ